MGEGGELATRGGRERVWKEERVGGEKDSVWRLSGNVQGREGGQHSTTTAVFPQECGPHKRVGSGRDLIGIVPPVFPTTQLPLFIHVPKPTFDVIREGVLNSNQYINGWFES